VARLLRVARAMAYPLPLPVAMLLGEMGGLAAWAISPGSRRAARGHLDSSLAGPGHAATVRRVFLNLGRAAAEILVARRIGIEAFARRVTVEGEEHLLASLADGRGVLAVTAHFGNFELLAALVARRCDLKVVGKRPQEGDATDLVTETRAGFGVETISQTNPRGILRALRGGAVVGLLPDQDIDRLEGIFIPFFGRPAYTPTGPATMSFATGAPIVPLFLRREGRTRHRLVYHPPIRPDRDADRDAEVRRLTVEWSAVVEEEIAARPDLWVWFHRRWETTPESLLEVRARRAAEAARPRRTPPPGPPGG